MGKQEQRESFKCKESHWHRGVKDGTAVDISTGVAIYTAMILKVCGK